MTPEPGSAAPAGGQELSDLSALKALAQPRRQQILQHLALHGPATSAMLARGLGLNTGATSYHLRELARYGFTEESSAQGPSVGGRERWWRAVPGDRRFPPRSRQNPETRLVMDELNHLSYAADLELFERLQRQGQDLGEWADAFPYSRGTIRLTLPELRSFFEEFIALLNRYKRPDSETPDGARTVLTRLLAFPAPAHPDGTRVDGTRPDGAHVDDTRADDAPSHQAPADGVPAHRAPADGVPLHRAPADGAPAHQAHAHRPPAACAPSHPAPADGTLVHQAPPHRPPADDASAHRAPAACAPAHQAHAHRPPAACAPSHQAPADGAPVHQAPPHRPPADGVPPHQAHAHHAPADGNQAPVDEIPALHTTTETDTP
ncbi:helix-turn-helix domain-containing protein [Streptomyces longhuiensis]|uniref:helix-turn-helix domain-containing protein n=1 Tax=Streptomyces longhuiensis TaxID=2880933 RepID=UPI001D0BDCD2|nr:helix-turn-helix domain-containing protein [Streptomyces longhuiensis]UDM02483.1 helix-turn-helix domain-containing protein [Streptomyces longhuiensis]